MIDVTWRIAKRFAVLIPGIVIAYFSVRNIFPYFDSRLPLGIAVFITYVLGAYVLIPAFIRLVRIIKPVNHLPLYCVTPDGFASDPINIGIIGTRSQLKDAMEQAGWYEADPHTIRKLPKYILSTLLGWAYPNAPVSSLFLFGRKQDIAFEIPIEGSSGGRHHVRFWATTFKDKKRLTVQHIQWHHRRMHVRDDTLLWVGAASLDMGLAPIRHNLQITHMIHPDTNKERKMIVTQLKGAGLIASTQSLKLGNPYRLINRAWRGSLHTDGKMTVLKLKAD
jgi:hypothetical protein